MAALRHTFHGRFFKQKAIMLQTNRTYIPVSSSILQSRTDLQTQPLTLKPLRNSHFISYGFGGYVQHRSISRETIAYYMSSDNPPIGCAEKLFQNIHEVTGLPWWAAILLTTWGLRSSITVPLAIYTSHVMSRLEKLGPEMKEMAKQLKTEVMMAKKQNDWTEKEAYRQFKINVRITWRKPFCMPCKLRPSSNKKSFPVHRPGGLKRAYWNFFFLFSIFFFLFTPPPPPHVHSSFKKMKLGKRKDSRPPNWLFICPPGSQETIFYLRVA